MLRRTLTLIFKVVLAFASGILLGLVAVEAGVYAFKWAATPNTPVVMATPVPDKPVEIDKTPDLTKVLHVVSRDGAAHACPVAPGVVLSAAHVIDPSGDPRLPAIPNRYSNRDGRVGIILPGAVANYADLASGVTLEDEAFYPLAALPPLPGEQLWWVGYDWRTQENFFGTRVFTGRVLRVVGGSIVLDSQTVSGTSGGCALNAKGEVVGIIVWKMKSEVDEKPLAIAAGVWGALSAEFMPTPEYIEMKRSK